MMGSDRLLSDDSTKSQHKHLMPSKSNETVQRDHYKYNIRTEITNKRIFTCTGIMYLNLKYLYVRYIEGTTSLYNIIILEFFKFKD